MTLETLASQAGISKALLSKIENSKVSSPLATFSKISKALGVPLSDLLKEEEQIKYLVVRKGDKKPALGRNTPQGFVYESLGCREGRGCNPVSPFCGC